MASSANRQFGSKTRSEAAIPFGSRTDVGCVRDQNEDSLIVTPPLFVVADGMGGHAAGEIASEIAVRTIQECAPAHADATALGRAVEQANRDIINAAIAGEGREGMGTTCTAAILEGNRLVIAQVGDSRAYLLHGGMLTQLTRDHSLMANLIEAGQITPEEARVHPNRSVITRALGNDPDTTPDLYEINVESGDRLLLCSDGLSSMLEDDEIQAVMRRIEDPQQCASMLVNGALVAGGFDNVTVVIVDVEGGSGRARKRLAVRTKLTALFIVLLLAFCIVGAAWGGSAYLHHTAYLAETEDGTVAVYRGVPGEVLGFSYSELVEDSGISVDDLPLSAAQSIRSDKGMRVDSVDEALSLVESYRKDIQDKQAASSASPVAGGGSATQSSDGGSASVDSASASSTSDASASASADGSAQDEGRQS